ncbi:fatty-acyl-CoA synthase [Collimonas sp. OK607]|uniref:AMP-binding protein n=1 Tax=Collimonas sp. OK607 TaxID=1798194 RepID=UPI0008ED3FE5|nr:AMP-binding protein [Collimonas sp. OK607]SFA82745.1 fatty-acyl-CoA synthase [Collimonas sp. OK607]
MARTFNLADLFEVVAGVVPERIAFICGAHRLSFRQLDERATRLACGLRARGIGRLDNVGIQLYNSAEYLETFLACCKIGAAPVNVNYRYVADELTYLFTSLDLKLLVYGAQFDVEVGKVLPRVATLKNAIRVGAEVEVGAGVAGVENYESVLTTGEATLDDPERSDNDLYMLCTGGTTGMPKGVVWPHKSLFMGALGGGGFYLRCPPIGRPEDLERLVPQASPLVFFASAPMMHGAAMWASLISLYSGHTVVVNDQTNFDAEHAWDVVVRDGVNSMSVVGDAMATPLIQALEAHPQRWDLNALMLFGNGGAVLSGHLQERMKAAVPHIMFNNNMGSSEMGVVGGGNRPAHGEGYMVLQPSEVLAVIDEQMCIVTAPGSQGVLARTGYTPISYYRDPEKSAEVFVTVNERLWVLSGDRARIDEEGRIVMLGRGSQCINSGGEKIFTEEVEEAARRCPTVQDVLVIGIADERWGQKVAAIVEVMPGAEFSATDFQYVCRQYLSGYKVPRAVFLTDKVMRSPAGKADYRWAKEYVTQHGSVI